MTADHRSDPNDRGTAEPGKIKVPPLKPRPTADAAAPDSTPERQRVTDEASTPQRPPAPARSLDRFSMLDRTDELEANAIISQPLLGEGIRSGQLTIIYAEPNTEKTLIINALGRTAILAGLIAPTDFLLHQR